MKILKRIFIDGLSGMAIGLFATLIIGTILEQAGTIIGGDIGNMIVMVASIAKVLTGAGIGIGVANRSTLKHQFSTEYGIQREVSMSEELKNIEIYYDNTFIEIYLNDGKDTMTLRAFPENVEINLI